MYSIRVKRDDMGFSLFPLELTFKQFAIDFFDMFVRLDAYTNRTAIH